MNKKHLAGGVVHKLPNDLRDALLVNQQVSNSWQDISPLARNEFICWVEEAKQVKTRERRVRRTCEELAEGKRRPCCWIGCVHRKDKAISPSVKAILAKRTKKST